MCFALGVGGISAVRAGVAAVPGSKMELGADESSAEELTPDEGAVARSGEAFAGGGGGDGVGGNGAPSGWAGLVSRVMVVFGELGRSAPSLKICS